MAVPFPSSATVTEHAYRPATGKTTNWAAYAAAGSLVAGSALLLSGRRRAGMVAATAGAALALLDQQEVVLAWWNTLPGYLEEAQILLSHAQRTIDELAAQRDRLHRVLSR